MVKKSFLFTIEGLIGAIIITMTGLYVYRTFLAVEASKTGKLEDLGYSILEALDQEGKLAKYITNGNYSGLEQEIQEMLGAGIESRLKVFQYQVINVTSTKRTNWPIEVSLNFPKQVNPNFIQVYDSEMNLIPSQLDWSWYRISVTIENDNQERENWPFRIDLEFAGFDVNGDGLIEIPDKNSIRIFTKSGREIPCVVKNWRNNGNSYSGSVAFLLDLDPGETKNLFVYYSVGTMKEPKSYNLPKFNLLPEASGYFIRHRYIWEIEPYRGVTNATVHYKNSLSAYPELWGDYTAIHLYRMKDIVNLIFTDGGTEGSNCNWTDSRAEMNLTYPSGSEIVLSDDECPGRDEFDLAGDPTGSWGGDEDGGILELPRNWTIVEIDPLKATNDDLRWYSNGERINLTVGIPITVYGLPPQVTHGVVEKAPRADLIFLTNLSSNIFYVKFSIGTNKTRWKTQVPETDLVYSNDSIENSKLKLSWGESNGSTITELVYKEYGDENLVGGDEDGNAFDLPIIEDRTFSPPKRLSPWFTTGNFSILYKGPFRIIAKSHSEKFRSSTGEEKNITRDCYYKFYSKKSFFEVYAKYEFLDNVTAKWGDYYPTSQRIDSANFDWVAYVGEDGRIIPSGRVTDTTDGNWIDEWGNGFGVAQIVKGDYLEVRYGKNDVTYGQFKKYGENHEFVKGTQECFRYWWYFHLGNYTEGNVSELASQLVEKPKISLRYDIPDGTAVTETVLPKARSVASISYFVVNGTFVEINLILWYKL